LDRFTADLCDALRETDPGQGDHKVDGDEFIGKLINENLFLIALDNEARWFRYHDLFRDLLKAQLKKSYTREEISSLHSRASEWFDTEGLVNEAIQHALTAGNENKAVQLIEQNRQVMLNSDRWYVFEKWLSLLPDTVIQQRSELMLAQTWVHYFNYRFDLIPPTIDAAESLLSNDPEERPQYGEIYLFRGAMYYMMGDGINSMENLENATKLIPKAHQMVRGFAEIYFGLASQMTGQEEKVIHVLSDLLSDPSLELPRKMRVLTALVWIHLISGDLSVASTLNKQLMDAATQNNIGPFISWGLYNQGLVHFQRNELDSAIHHFSQATESGYLMLRRADVDCMVGLLLAYQVKQEKDKADATLESLFKYVGPFNDPVLLEIAHSCRDRLSLIRGAADSIRGIQGINRKTNPGALAIWLEVPVITQCRVLLARESNTHFREAEMKLLEFMKLNRTHHNTYQLIEVMTLLAMACEKQGKTEEALTFIGRALKLARPGGFIFPFLEIGEPMADLLKRLIEQNVAPNQLEKILKAFEDINATAVTKASVPDASSPSTPTPQPLIEPLSNRELEILELLAKRFQNKEIAEKLFISPNTVRTHLQNIYQKLNTSNRRQAVDRAFDLGILSSR
jgi:LuxR family maltose regulon positive regulatory protein